MKITIFHSIPFRSEFLLLLQRVVSGLSSSLHVYYILTLATAALYCIRRSLRRWCIVCGNAFCFVCSYNAELNVQNS